MPKLYELSLDYQKLMELIENTVDSAEDESYVEDLEMYKDTLDAIKDSIDVKCNNIVKFLKNIEGDIEAFKKEEKRLEKRRKAMESKQAGLKKYMEDMLRLANIKELKTDNFKIKFQKSPASVEILNEESVPEEYKKYEVKVSKSEILKALKEEKVIPGVVLVTDKEHMKIT
jgi:hypothetical protein